MKRFFENKYAKIVVFLAFLGIMFLSGNTVKADSGYTFDYSAQRVTSVQGSEGTTGIVGERGYFNIWDPSGKHPMKSVSITVSKGGTTECSYSGTVNNTIFSLPFTPRKAGEHKIVASLTDMNNVTYTGTFTRTFYDSEPIISSHPSSKSVTEGTAVSFSVSLKQGSNVKYQWYRRLKGSNQWVKIPGATLRTYTIPAKSVKTSLNGSSYRCELDNDSFACMWGEIYSKAATLSVKKPSLSKIQVKLASANSVKLTWKKIDKATGYIVYRSSSKYGSYKKIATTKKTAYTDKKLKRGRTYYYKVAHYNKQSTGKKSSAASKKIPLKPSKIRMSLSAKAGSFTLTWANAKNADKVEIWRSIDNGKWKRIKTLPANKKRYTGSYENFIWNEKCSFKVRGFWKKDGVTVYGNYSSAQALKR